MKKKLHIDNCTRMIKHWEIEFDNAKDYKERDQIEMYINIVKSTLRAIRGTKKKRKPKIDKPKTYSELLARKCKLLVYKLNKQRNFN